MRQLPVALTRLLPLRDARHLVLDSLRLPARALMLPRLAHQATGTAGFRALPFVVGHAFNLTLDTTNE